MQVLENIADRIAHALHEVSQHTVPEHPILELLCVLVVGLGGAWPQRVALHEG